MPPTDDGRHLDANFFAGSSAPARSSYDRNIPVQKASYRPPVPNEIWSKIWSLLALDDRLAVTRVCTEWRRMAHSQRSLWNHLDFRTTRHEPNCPCRICEPKDGSSSSSDWGDDEWLWEVSNLHHASRVLPLSGNLELHITLEVQAYDAPHDELYALGAAMVPHVDRIATLIIRTADIAGYYTFLGRFNSLPALRILIGTLMGTRGRSPYGSPFARATLNVPELRTVRLGRGFCFPAPHIGRTYPNAQEIAVSPARSVSDGVLQALAACPTLHTFALHLHPFERHAPSDDPVTAVQQRAAALRAVTVTGLDSTLERWVLAALVHPALRTLALEYDTPHDVSLGWPIFASLPSPLTLHVSLKTHWPECKYPTSDSVFCFQTEDASGRTRRMALHHCEWDEAHAALAHLSAMQLRKIVSPCRLWPLVRDALGLRALDAADLVVSAHDIPARDEVIVTNGELELRALTLIYDGPGSPSLPAARVQQLVSRARARLPLDVLMLDRRLAASVPDGLARTVLVTSCSPPDFSMPAPFRDTTRYESESASEDSDLDESD